MRIERIAPPNAKLLPGGVQQTHDGQLYRLFCFPSGRLIPVGYTPTKQVDDPIYERIMVESQAYKAALDIKPQNEMQARKLKAIIDRGPVYETIAFFHIKGRSV